MYPPKVAPDRHVIRACRGIGVGCVAGLRGEACPITPVYGVCPGVVPYVYGYAFTGTVCRPCGDKVVGAKAGPCSVIYRNGIV